MDPILFEIDEQSSISRGYCKRGNLMFPDYPPSEKWLQSVLVEVLPPKKNVFYFADKENIGFIGPNGTMIAKNSP